MYCSMQLDISEIWDWESFPAGISFTSRRKDCVYCSKLCWSLVRVWSFCICAVVVVEFISLSVLSRVVDVGEANHLLWRAWSVASGEQHLSIAAAVFHRRRIILCRVGIEHDETDEYFRPAAADNRRACDSLLCIIYLSQLGSKVATSQWIFSTRKRLFLQILLPRS